jgi:hypothetical protein
MSDNNIVKMARLAQRDDRMTIGKLYGDLADRIEELERERKAMAMRDAGYDVYAALEAKLAKAVEALQSYAKTSIGFLATEVLAELEGQ